MVSTRRTVVALWSVFVLVPVRWSRLRIRHTEREHRLTFMLFRLRPQVSKMQYDKIFSYIEAGKQAGAKCVVGGEKRPGKGYFVDPTSKCLAHLAPPRT